MHVHVARREGDDFVELQRCGVHENGCHDNDKSKHLKMQQALSTLRKFIQPPGVRTRRLHRSYRRPPEEMQVLAGYGWTEVLINHEGNGVRREGGCLQSQVHASDCGGRRRDCSATRRVSIQRRRFRGHCPFMLKYPCRLTAVMIGRSRVDQRPSWPGRGSRRPSGARVSWQIRQDRAGQPHPSKPRGLSCGERASQFDPSRRGLSRRERASLLDPSQWDRASRLDPRAAIRRGIGARSHFAEIS
jgi:hypothetical protein